MELLRRFRRCLKAAEPKMELEIWFSSRALLPLRLSQLTRSYLHVIRLRSDPNSFFMRRVSNRNSIIRTPINDRAWQKQTPEFIVVTSIYLINFLNYFLLPPRSPIVSRKLRSIFSFFHTKHDMISWWHSIEILMDFSGVALTSYLTQHPELLNSTFLVVQALFVLRSE